MSVVIKPELTCGEYNKKSFYVRGDRKKYSKLLKDVKARWNSRMHGGEGWLVPIENVELLKKIIENVNSGGLISVSSTESPIQEKVSVNSVPVSSPREPVVTPRTSKKNELLSDISSHVKSRKEQKKFHRAISREPDELKEEVEPEQEITPYIKEKDKPKHRKRSPMSSQKGDKERDNQERSERIKSRKQQVEDDDSVERPRKGRKKSPEVSTQTSTCSKPDLVSVNHHKKKHPVISPVNSDDSNVEDEFSVVDDLKETELPPLPKNINDSEDSLEYYRSFKKNPKEFKMLNSKRKDIDLSDSDPESSGDESSSDGFPDAETPRRTKIENSEELQQVYRKMKEVSRQMYDQERTRRR